MPHSRRRFFQTIRVAIATSVTTCRGRRVDARTGRGSEFVVGALAPYPKPVPQRVGARASRPLAPDLTIFGKGHRLGGLHPIAEGKSVKSGGSPRHVGEPVVRRLSRK